jgi:hypothetical protein
LRQAHKLFIAELPSLLTKPNGLSVVVRGFEAVLSGELRHTKSGTGTGTGSATAPPPAAAPTSITDEYLANMARHLKVRLVPVNRLAVVRRRVLSHSLTHCVYVCVCANRVCVFVRSVCVCVCAPRLSSPLQLTLDQQIAVSLALTLSSVPELRLEGLKSLKARVLEMSPSTCSPLPPVILHRLLFTIATQEVRVPCCSSSRVRVCNGRATCATAASLA